jgi:DNA helicase IV
LTKYVEFLREFYRSEHVQLRVRELLGVDGLETLNTALEEQESNKCVSRTDLYYLLWLVHLQTQGNQTSARRHASVPVYSHIVIDEAQYYERIVLRLLADLAQLPQGVMTVVGDLEQRILTKGGLATWQDAGLDVQEENIQRLDTNYRWS